MRIGVLTGGGDCPGLNAVIRAVVRTCDARYGSSVVGFLDGWRGLLEDRRIQLANDDRNDRLLAKGGTMLGTARTNPDKLRAGLDQIKQTLEDNGIDVLVQRYLHDPVVHSVDSEQSPVSAMVHHVLHVDHDARFEVLADLAERYRLSERERRLQVRADSPLANQVLNELQLRREHGINVIAIERRQRLRTLLLMANGNTLLEPGDVLLVDIASPTIGLLGSYQALGLEPMPLAHSYFSLHAHELGLAEVALPPESQLPGKTIQELGFRSRHKLNVVGLRRQGQALEGVLVDEKLKASDTLLVAGAWRDIHRLQGLSRDFLVLSLPAEVAEVAPAARKAPYALLSLAVMVGLMVSGLVPNVQAALIACLLMGAFRCIDLDSAYRAIHWPTLILIVGMLPFAQALQQTGGVELAVKGLVGGLGGAGPHLILASLFALTAVIGLFISNTATAVLMAPVAIATAQALGASPLPFAMTVALAASAAFMTPISSPVNTLVLGPGQYRFGDFVRIGVPFTVLVMIVAVLLVPLVFPL